MDTCVFKKEMESQLDIVNSLSLNKSTVEAIDSHIKDVEARLNAELIYLDARVVIWDFRQKEVFQKYSPKKVSSERWNTLRFKDILEEERGIYEALSYERTDSKWGFIYRKYDVVYDVKIVDETDYPTHYEREYHYYYKESSREENKFPLTGAPVHVKLHAFCYLSDLLSVISEKCLDVQHTVDFAQFQREAVSRLPK